ncbi:ATP-binding protein [uncultured Desulfobacter sp.]|uniref:ATP-binding protein n=1 Tax=uncultured Desulfobacter sp. TaxID=240139 RepID=UPI002AAA7464|nr:ATP-binding protein [uncultured Desulfobacter sp.]
MKEDFISDKRRISYLAATYNRIYRGQSVLIEGDFGAGKTRFLKLLHPKKLHAVWVESLFNIHETLAAILKELNYEATATYRRTPQYLKMICNLSNCFIVIDEANDLDAGVPIIFAGLPKVRTHLSRNHPDILSRLKTLILYPIEVEDFIENYKDIQQEAVEQIYMSVKGDMRKFKELCTDCRDRAKELNHQFVDINLALEFISDLPPQ